MGKILLKDIGLDLEHVEGKAGILGILITGLGAEVMEVVHLVGVVLGGHVHYLELLLRLCEIFECSLGILDPAVFDDQISILNNWISKILINFQKYNKSNPQ